MVDAGDSKSPGGNTVPVRVRPRVPFTPLPSPATQYPIGDFVLLGGIQNPPVECCCCAAARANSSPAPGTIHAFAIPCYAVPYRRLRLDRGDSKSPGGMLLLRSSACRFESGPGYHSTSLPSPATQYPIGDFVLIGGIQNPPVECCCCAAARANSSPAPGTIQRLCHPLLRSTLSATSS